MESKRKTTPLSSSVPPSKRVHGNLHSPPVPSKPAITIAGGEEDEEVKFNLSSLLHLFHNAEEFILRNFHRFYPKQ